MFPQFSNDKHLVPATLPFWRPPAQTTWARCRHFRAGPRFFPEHWQPELLVAVRVAGDDSRVGLRPVKGGELGIGALGELAGVVGSAGALGVEPRRDSDSKSIAVIAFRAAGLLIAR